MKVVERRRKTHVVLSTIISARDPARVGVCACTHSPAWAWHTEHPGGSEGTRMQGGEAKPPPTQMATRGGEHSPQRGGWREQNTHRFCLIGSDCITYVLPAARYNSATR